MDGAGGDITEDCGITVRKCQYLKGRVGEHGLNGCNGGRAKKSKPGVESWFSGGMAEKAKLEPRMVRFEPVVLMLRLKVKLRTRLRTDALWKDKTVLLQRSYPHLAGGSGRWMMLLVNLLMLESCLS